MQRKRKPKSNIDRLLWYISRVTPLLGANPCWEYMPDKYTDYIHMKTRGCEYFATNSTLLHRFIYAVYNDTHLTPENVIMHTCDNRICINPKHLVLGTIQTNNADRTRKAKRTKRTKPTK